MNKSEKFWDRQANSFAQEGDGDDSTFNKALTITKKYLKDSDVVLDYGCATGKLAFTISDLVQAVEGVDISSKMIVLAQQGANERQITNTNFAQSTIFNAPYPNEAFDAVLAFNILHLLDDAQSDIQKISQLLKSGGFFISTTPCLGEKRAFFWTALSILSKTGLVPKTTKFKTAELEDVVGGGGFQIVETEILSPEYSENFIVARKV